MTQEELIRERDFYRAKLEEEKTLVKTLRFDNAELQKNHEMNWRGTACRPEKPINLGRPSRSPPTHRYRRMHDGHANLRC